MSEALSASTTFQALAGRVSVLEASPTFTGIITAPTLALDANFTIQTNAGNPQLSFDTGGDTLTYARSTNTYSFAIGGSAQLAINSGSVNVSNLLTVGDTNFGLNFNSGTQPYVAFSSGAYLSFVRGSSTFSFGVGGVTRTTIDGSGNLVAGGYIAASGDTNFFLQLVSNSPRIALDANDNIAYDRSGNVLTFNIGGTPILTVAAGSVSIVLSAIPTYADNTAATTGGLGQGGLYRTSTGQLMVRY